MSASATAEVRDREYAVEYRNHTVTCEAPSPEVALARVRRRMIYNARPGTWLPDELATVASFARVATVR